MTRSSSRDMSCDFDGMLDDLSDMEGGIVGPCDLDKELTALSELSDFDCGGGDVHPWIPLMNGIECVDDSVSMLIQTPLDVSQGPHCIQVMGITLATSRLVLRLYSPELMVRWRRHLQLMISRQSM